MHNQQSLPTNITNWNNTQLKKILILIIQPTPKFFSKNIYNLSNNYEKMNQQAKWQPFMGSS
jgi:hypothetical protein